MKPIPAEVPYLSGHIFTHRGSGNTEILALATLATALANPEVPVMILNHYHTHLASELLADRIHDMALDLKLDVTVSRRDLTVTALKRAYGKETSK